jgi:hypothetical protein
MSTEDNNQTPESTEEKIHAAVEKAEEKMHEAIETAEEKVSEAVEAAEAGAAEAKEKAGAAAAKILAAMSDLKQKNPKVFFGAIGAVVLIIGYLMFFGGKPEVISGPAQLNLVVGQNYTLKTPNSAGEKPLIRMVSTPGQMEAYDDTEETDREGCKNLPEGTGVAVKDLFKQPGMNFARVEILDGDCKGKIMWTLAVNVH